MAKLFDWLISFFHSNNSGFTIVPLAVNVLEPAYRLLLPRKPS